MAAVSWSDVIAAAPELATVALASQSDILGVANVRLAVGLFGGEADPMLRLARILYAAHLAAMIRLGVSGPLIGESVGGMSRTYAAPFMGRGQLGMTSYGMALLALMPPATRGPQVL
ncbi:MAG: DUF4054 domain-containing protein [Actinobacteria bacterium]|nr:DUF4054 domain-containing protein [Actinomycetota bacterium]